MFKTLKIILISFICFALMFCITYSLINNRHSDKYPITIAIDVILVLITLYLVKLFIQTIQGNNINFKSHLILILIYTLLFGYPIYKIQMIVVFPLNGYMVYLYPLSILYLFIGIVNIFAVFNYRKYILTTRI